jgi:hypothetical protein
VRASIEELLEEVAAQAKQHIVARFAASPMHEIIGAPFVALGEPIAIGERGNRYQLSVFPAITNLAPIRAKPAISVVFATVAPTGELRQRRDDEEEDRRPGVPNRACTEMAYELNASSPAMQNITTLISDRFRIHWPDFKFVHFVTVSNTDLDLVLVFVNPQSLEQLARDVGAA